VKYLALVLTVAACSGAAAPPAEQPAVPAREPIALTYLGVAGWTIEAGGKVILADPFLSRVAWDAVAVSDPAAIAAHTPARADLIVIGHSHVDHLLDAPAVALRTGAQLMGSMTTAYVARASGVPAEQIIPVKGGEDYELGGFSVRVIPSLHSAIEDKHAMHGVFTAPPTMPLKAVDYAEGGTLAYLVRAGGHEILILSTANFIERELEGLRPDIAIVAVGLREAIHDYTCRLMTALGRPRIVYANHFDDWLAPPKPVPAEELADFVDEVHRCAPDTEVIVPRHFERMVVP
jgi:L-ascorbate metabolism protein UlaG (beta-lactamase superfamily)